MSKRYRLVKDLELRRATYRPQTLSYKEVEGYYRISASEWGYYLILPPEIVENCPACFQEITPRKVRLPRVVRISETTPRLLEHAEYGVEIGCPLLYPGPTKTAKVYPVEVEWYEVEIPEDETPQV